MRGYAGTISMLNVNAKVLFRVLWKSLVYVGSIGLLMVVVASVVVGLSILQKNINESERVGIYLPKQSRYVQAHDVRVFVQTDGPITGKPVLLVHGMGAWSELWRETMTALAEKGYRVYAMDLPPFGFSEKPLEPTQYTRELQAKRIAGVLESLELQDVVIVAHSVGSRPVVEVALAYPERIKELVLVAPALGVTREGIFEQAHPSWLVSSVFSHDGIRDGLQSVLGTNPLFTRTLFKQFVENEKVITEDRIDVLRQPTRVEGLTHGVSSWMEYLVTMEDASLTSNLQRLSEYTKPVTLIWGSSDNITPLWQGELLQKLFSHATLHVITDVGHMPYIEDEQEFQRILIEALKQ